MSLRNDRPASCAPLTGAAVLAVAVPTQAQHRDGGQLS